MKVSVIQISSGTSVEKNILSSKKMIENAFHDDPDLIIFPEYQMLLPDYSSPDTFWQKSETVSGRFVTQFMKMSEEYGAAIALNIAEKSDDGSYNTALVVQEEKVIHRYRKIHLFDAYDFHESSLYKMGKEIPEPFSLNDMRISVFICYDLRFPELSLKASCSGSDIIIYQSGWYKGKNKVNQWNSLLAARAIETGCYTIGAANCQQQFTGRSTVYDPNSRRLAFLNDRPGIISVDLSRQILQNYRKKVPVRDQRKSLSEYISQGR